MSHEVKGRRRIGALLAAGLAALLLGGCNEVKETTLANGLKVIVKPDRRAPVVVSQIWYKVGASDDPAGQTGVSHVLEHMMFEGTERYGTGEFSRIIAENGGRENAFTGADYTAYFQQLERSRLAIAFELEADRMQNLLLDEKAFRKELKVVMEERRLRTDDRPESRVYEQFMATAYKVHPYKQPIIGWWQDLERLTVENVRAWYWRWYTPNNATLVVVGDVKPRAVFALAKKYFGAIKPRPLERAPLPSEPAQTSTRRVRVSAPARVPYMVLGFHVPAYGESRESWEPYALSVLAGILDGGRSARLPRELVRGAGIAARLDSGYDAVARSATMLVFDGTPAEGRTLAELEGAILEQIERLKREPVGAQELKRVKAQVIAQDVFGLDSVFYQAMRMGMLETIGRSWRLMRNYIDRINAVTPTQVQEVARRYLVARNLTVAVLDPLPIAPSTRRTQPSTGGRHVN
jgi:zinc protease